MVDDAWRDGTSEPGVVALAAGTSRRRQTLIIGRLVALAVCAGAVGAAAAPASASCVTGLTTLTSSGCYTVPSGMTDVTVTATGAKGGEGGVTAFQPGGLGGSGGQVTDTLSVTAGEQLNITVGGNGGRGQDGTAGTTQGGSGGAGGANGGAGGGNGGGFEPGDEPVNYGGAGGGGGATTVDDASGNLLLEGGGGGGGGGNGWNSTASGGTGGCGSQNGDSGASGGRGPANGGLLAPAQPSGDWTGSNGGAGGIGGGGIFSIGFDGDPPGGGGGGGFASGGSGGAGGLLWPDGAGNPPFYEYGGGGGGGGSSYGPSGSTFVDCSSSAARVQVTDTYGPPQATGSAATSVTSTSATLNGAVNPFNKQTTYQFVYNDNIAGYLGSVPASPASVGSDNTYHSVSQTLTGLEPNHEYFESIFASNAAGDTSAGSGQESFATLPAAPAATTSAATSVTGSDATLNGTVNPENSSTTYYFQYGATTSYGSEIPISAASVGSDYSSHSESQTLTNLTPGQPYYYRMVAVDTTGTTDGAQQTFTTLAVPGAPSDVKATADDGQATVTFTPPTTGGTPSSYIVTAADQTTPGNGGQTATAGASPITVTGLTDGDSYTFTVVAKNTVGPGLSGGPSNAVTPMATPGTALFPEAYAGPGEAELSFKLPTEPSGSPISGWTLTATDVTTPANGGQTATTTNTDSCSGSAPYESCVGYVTGLTNGDSYTVTVTLDNADEGGPASSASNAVSPAAPIIRSLSFGGASGYFVDLYNPAPQSIHLGNGWTLNDSENESTCPPYPCASGAKLSNLTIPARGNYLVSGSGYSLGSDPGATPDLTTSWSNYQGDGYGVNVTAPDGHYSDAVGYTDAPAINNLGESWYVSGTGLTVPASPAGDGAGAAFVRRYTDGVPVDTGDNAADFVLVAPDAGPTTYGGLAELGVASPADAAAPVAHAEILQAGAVAGGVSYAPGVDGQPGQLTVNQTITNCSGQTLTGACVNATAAPAASVTRLQLQLTSLTTTGSPGAGAGQAVLIPETSTATSPAAPTCAGTGSLTLLAPSVSGIGAGLNSVWDATSQLPGATGQNPAGGLPAGACVNVQLRFAVLQAGRYSFGYNELDDLIATPTRGPATAGPTNPGSSPAAATPSTAAPTATTAAPSPPASLVTVQGTLTSTGASATLTQTSTNAKTTAKKARTKAKKARTKAKKVRSKAKHRANAKHRKPRKKPKAGKETKKSAVHSAGRRPAHSRSNGKAA